VREERRDGGELFVRLRGRGLRNLTNEGGDSRARVETLRTEKSAQLTTLRVRTKQTTTRTLNTFHEVVTDARALA